MAILPKVKKFMTRVNKEFNLDTNDKAYLEFLLEKYVELPNWEEHYDSIKDLKQYKNFTVLASRIHCFEIASRPGYVDEADKDDLNDFLDSFKKLTSAFPLTKKELNVKNKITTRLESFKRKKSLEKRIDKKQEPVKKQTETRPEPVKKQTEIKQEKSEKKIKNPAKKQEQDTVINKNKGKDDKGEEETTIKIIDKKLYQSYLKLCQEHFIDSHYATSLINLFIREFQNDKKRDRFIDLLFKD